MKNTHILVCCILVFFGTIYDLWGEDTFELSLSFGVGDFHITGDRTLYYSKTKIHEAFGHVVMSSNNRRLSADYISIDTKTGDAKASGNVVFASPERTIYAAEVHFNVYTGLASIFYGLITNGRYHLRGQLIREVSKNRFIATEGEYTTCLDCSESWRISAQNIDLSTNGYVFMKGVYLFIKDTPAVYLPYLILPVKTERQSGLLFPRISNSSRHGFTLYQPLFLAISDHQDATLSYGFYSKRGSRAGLQYRYKLLKNNEGTIDGVFVKDRTFPEKSLRFALQMDHTLYPFHFAKLHLRINEVSDRDYPRVFSGDIGGNNLPALESSAVLMSDFDDFFVDLEWTRLRSLIAKDKVRFDEDMVQRGPSLFFGLKERRLWQGITGSVFFRYDRFHRRGSSFFDANGDGVYSPLTADRLRESHRILLNPSLSHSFKIEDVLTVSPLLEYDQRFYSFDDASTNDVKNLLNHHLLSQVRISTEIEKVFNLNGSEYSKLKHQISPFITYSNIFWKKNSSDHPFTQQAKEDGGIFDELDRVPITYSRDNLREPLGNAISYGFTSRFIRKLRKENHISFYPYDLTKTIEKKYPKPQNRAQEIQILKQRHWDKYAPDYDLYKEIWSLSVNQSYDFKEAQSTKPDGSLSKPFAPLLVRSLLTLHHFQNHIEYKYKPYGKLRDNDEYSARHELKLGVEWDIENISNRTATRVRKKSVFMGFELFTEPNASKKLSLGFTWSLTDDILFSYYRRMDLLELEEPEQTISTIYNSPSECWQLRLRYEENREVGKQIHFKFGLNLVGSGYSKL